MKAATDAGREIHRRDRDQNRGDHDADVLHHADRGDDGIDREDQIDGDDLRDDQAEGACRATGFGRCDSSVRRFDLAVNFVGRLGDQEQTAADQDQVVP